jgi:hypothetical protein
VEDRRPIAANPKGRTASWWAGLWQMGDSEQKSVASTPQRFDFVEISIFYHW